MKIIIQQVNTQNEKNECMSIRRSVFIEEQNIPEMIELDDSVIKSTNFLAIYDGNFIGTARYRITNLGIKLERFAVLKDYRGVGAGKSLVRFIIKSIKSRSIIYLHAQEPVIKFYTKLGFTPVGDIFYEADIPHKKLIKQ